MRTPIPAIAAVAAIVTAVALIAGCENDLDPLAPSDGVIDLQANPSAIVLDQNVPFAPRDPETGLLVGTTSIRATVFDKTGHPLGGVGVYFSTSGGRLASATAPGTPPRSVITNPSGIATDTLTVKESDPAEITVTASSSLVTKTVTVTRTIQECRNEEPTVNAGPDQTQTGGVLPVPVVLDGRGTFDAETPNFQLLFLWNCGNGTSPAAAPGLENLFPQVVQCSYEAGGGTVAATYDATLTVTDTGNGLQNPDTGDFLCKKTASDAATITIEDGE